MKKHTVKQTAVFAVVDMKEKKVRYVGSKSACRVHILQVGLDASSSIWPYHKTRMLEK